MKRKTFKDCITKNELLELGDKDTFYASELLKMAEHKERFWDEANLEEKYPSLYVEGHYEIIKELCSAVLTLDGWKATNHECLFAYLIQNRQDLEIDFEYLLELKDTRNDIDYRGVKISAETWKNNKLKITLITRRLKEYLNGQLKCMH